MFGWSVLYYLVSFLELLILVRVVLSWVAPASRNEAVLLVRSVTDLVLQPIRSILPATGAFDFAPMVAMFVLYFIQGLIRGMMY